MYNIKGKHFNIFLTTVEWRVLLISWKRGYSKQILRVYWDTEDGFPLGWVMEKREMPNVYPIPFLDINIKVKPGKVKC